MTRKNLYYGTLVLGAAATLTLAVTLTLSLSRSHRKSSPAASAPVLAQVTTPAASEPKGAQKESIKVHGHWTIDVRNPDGTLVTHREFENAFVPSFQLAFILSRQRSVGEWGISLDTNNGVATPCGDHTPCLIVEPTSNVANSGNVVFKTLTLDTPQGPNSFKLLLSGNVTATTDGQVQSVTTLLRLCGSGIPPNSCTGSTVVGVPMTKTDLAIPVNGSCPPNTACVIDVAAGRIIQVTVLISFS